MKKWFAVVAKDGERVTAWGAGTSPESAMENARLVLSEVGETCDELRTVEIGEARYRSIVEEGRIDAEDLWAAASVTLEQALANAVRWAERARQTAVDIGASEAIVRATDSALQKARDAYDRVQRERAP